MPNSSVPRLSQESLTVSTKGTVQVNNASKVYEGKAKRIEALKEVDLTIRGGQFVSLIGRSGCGKSTLLRAIAGLHPLTHGSISIDGEPVTDQPRRSVGMMFQRPVLLPWRTVIQNVMLPVEVMGGDREVLSARALELLHRAGLGGYENSYPAQLSGGMQQRVSLCRLLVVDPEILLMDEPFGAVDEFSRERLQDDLIDLWENDHKTVVFVTHSISEAVYLSDQVVVMGAGPGRVLDVIDIPFERPRAQAIRRSPDFNRYEVMVREALDGGGAL